MRFVPVLSSVSGVRLVCALQHAPPRLRHRLLVMRPSLSPRGVRPDAHAMLQDAAKRTPPRRLLLEGAAQALLTGMIIAVVLTPVMIGFVTMIYGHPEFAAAMPMLTKLIFMSSVAHQLVITFLSPMPYAIAQTQDAGLIFLSSMAVSIMTELGDSVPMEDRIATVVVHLSISASLVGLGLIAIGKLRLASLVQYLPTPVIGGYLAYIGFFMIKGGITLMTGASLTGITSWGQLYDAHLVALLAPGLICGLLLSVISARYQHFAVFPCCLIAMPLVFFISLFATGYTVQDARDYGFLSEETNTISLVEVYGLFDFKRIHWEVMFPQQIPTMVSMFLVIAFASSLDIASICMGTGWNMDYNEQLQTVGASNLVSGLVGGYTGSYIFSQTVFSHRFHPAAAEKKIPGFSRLVGLSLAACELGIALLPFSLTTVVPKFLFGSVMIFIGVDLLRTWLFGVHSKLLMPEYATVISTFVFLNALGVQMGLAAGVALAAVIFLVEYSKGQPIRIVNKTSNVIRNAEQHQLLYSAVQGNGSHNEALMKGQPIVTVEVQGHIFFGSATRLQSRVRKAVFVYEEPSASPHRVARGADAERLPLLETGLGSSVSQSYAGTLVNLKGQPCGDLQRGRTRFVIFDFSQVTGMDATAARSCFLALKVLFRQHKITVVYCGMQPEVEYLLKANDVIRASDEGEDETHVTDDLDLALDWCEQQLIHSVAKKSIDPTRKAQGFFPPSGSATPELSTAQVLLAYVSQEKRRSLPDIERVIEEDVASRFTTERWRPGECIFSTGEASDALYLVLLGQVTLYTSIISAGAGTKTTKSSISDSLTPRHFRRQPQRHSKPRNGWRRSRRSASEPFGEEESRALVGRVRAGCIFGDMDFMLVQPRSFDGICSAQDTVTAKITRQELETMVASHPSGAYVLQEIVLRASYMTLAEKLHSIVV